jgi:hypothetical protein
LRMLKIRLIFLALTLFSISTTIWASETSPNKVELSFESFNDANEVQSHTGVLSYTRQWDEFWSVKYNQEVDGVTGASRKLANYARVGQVNYSTDAVSGATQNTESNNENEEDGVSGATTYEFRFGQGLQLTHSNHGTIWSGGVSTSFENDYRSFAPNLSWSQDFFDRNFTLGLTQSLFFDRFMPQEPFKASDPGGDKNISSTVVSIAQSLTPLTMFGANIGYTHAYGYLGHPYNPVTVWGWDMVPEHVPEIKSSTAISASLIQGFLISDMLGSVRLDYRYYTDSWGLHSNTYDLSLTQKFSEAFSVRLRSRYYQQSGVSFLADKVRARDEVVSENRTVYLSTDLYRTADIRFYPFSSVLGGIKFSGLFPETWTGLFPQEWEVKYDYLWRNTLGDRKLYQLYSEDEFYTQHDVLVTLKYLF